MEVEGKVTGEEPDTCMCNCMCKPCGNGNKRVPANGICRECEENMCIACFGNHKKYKMCKDHSLVDLGTNIAALSENKEQMVSESAENKDGDYELCDRHCNENIKFYCPGHDEVGCGDCMILQHKACKIEYVRDKAAAFVDSAEFKHIVSQIDGCRKGTSQCAISLKNNKIQIEDTHQAFLAEVKSFRDDINAYVETLEQHLSQETNKTKENDLQHIESLDNGCKELETELSEMSSSIESKTDDPSKLFGAAIHCKHKLRNLNQRLGAIMASNRISEYRFQRNSTIEQILQQANLGTVHLKDEITVLIDEHVKVATYYERPVSQCERPLLNDKEPVYMELKPRFTESREYARLEPGQYKDMTAGTIIERTSEEMKYVKSGETESKSVENEITSGENMERNTGTCNGDTARRYELGMQGERGWRKSGVYDINSREQIDIKSRNNEEMKLNTEPVLLPVRRSSQKKDISWSLLENQLRCDNLLMAGEFLSYKENGRDDPGLYICKKAIKTSTYLEIKLVSCHSSGNICIGFVPKDHPLREPPGHGRFSIGYHSADGCFYEQNTSGKRIGPPCSPGDVIGIGVSSYLSNVFKTKFDIFVTRNRKKIVEIEIDSPSFSKLYPAISLKSPGERVKVHTNVKER